MEAEASMSVFPVCSFCGMHFGDHEKTCPYGEQPSWDRDFTPDQRAAQEDKVYRDLREDEIWGP